MIVYAIFTGEYSDRDCIGIVETEEKAEEIRRIFTDYRNCCNCEIVEYDTNAFSTLKTNKTVYNVDPVTWEVRKFAATGMDGDCFIYGYFSECDIPIFNEFTDSYLVKARDEEHALKIARDMDAERKAIESGI